MGNIYPPHAPGGGYEITWRSAVAHLRGRGDEVRVLVSEHHEPGVSPEAPEDADVHRSLRWYWNDHAFPRRGLGEVLAIERHNAAVLDAHLEQFEPDAVCWWGMGGMSLGLIERVRRAGLPAVGVVGDEWMVWAPRVDLWTKRAGRAPRLAERLFGLPAQVDLRDAAIWLFNSDAVRRESVAAAGGLADARVEHPGIDDSLFRPAPAREWSWRLLYLGRMDERKGIHVAVEAMQHLPAEAELVIQGGGDPSYVERLRRRVAELGIDGRIQFSGERRERLGGVYARADAVLFPVQWEEPWGLVPLEAMAVGRPVVASGTGGSAEYLADGENCLQYAPRDSPEALAAAVTRLAHDAELRSRLRIAGFDTASRFTERRYNEAIAAALDEACERSGAAPARSGYSAAP